MTKKNEIIGFIIVIILVLYVLWFLFTRTFPVSMSDVLTVWGATLLMFTWFLSEAKKDIKEYIDIKIESMESKLKRFIGSSKK